MSRPPTTSSEGHRILRELRRIRPLLIGSLTTTRTRCGRENCRCQTRGELHETCLLTWSEDGKTRTLYVPKRLRAEVTRWLQEGERLKELTRQMAQAQRAFLQQRREATRTPKR